MLTVFSRVQKHEKMTKYYKLIQKNFPPTYMNEPSVPQLSKEL